MKEFGLDLSRIFDTHMAPSIQKCDYAVDRFTKEVWFYYFKCVACTNCKTFLYGKRGAMLTGTYQLSNDNNKFLTIDKLRQNKIQCFSDVYVERIFNFATLSNCTKKSPYYSIYSSKSRALIKYDYKVGIWGLMLYLNAYKETLNCPKLTFHTFLSYKNPE